MQKLKIVRRGIVITSLLTFILLLINLGACKKPSGPSVDPNEDEIGAGGDPSAVVPILGMQSAKDLFDIDDVTLSFFVGSERAGEKLTSLMDYPTVTYIYFGNELISIPHYFPNGDIHVVQGEVCSRYAENYRPTNLCPKIETDPNLFVCKKLLSSNEAFYKNNTVRRLAVEEKNAWRTDKPLNKLTKNGNYLPQISYEFTIPSSMFLKDEGYLLFCLATYLTEDYHDKNNGGKFVKNQLMEESAMIIYYEKDGDSIRLFEFYQGGKSNGK